MLKFKIGSNLLLNSVEYKDSNHRQGIVTLNRSYVETVYPGMIILLVGEDHLRLVPMLETVAPVVTQT